MNIFKIKEHAMDPQTTRSGKIKTDSNGEPLRSVQLLQSPEQRREMAKILNNMPRIYDECPELFPTGKHHIGNDPTSYTVADMMADCKTRMPRWSSAMSGAHIYRSFVERHNWCLDRLIEGLYAAGLEDEIMNVERDYRIKLRLPRQEEISRALKKSDIFDLYSE